MVLGRQCYPNTRPDIDIAAINIERLSDISIMRSAKCPRSFVPVALAGLNNGEFVTAEPG